MRLLFPLKILCLIAITGTFAYPTLAQDACATCAERYIDLAEDRRLQAKIDYLSPNDPLDLDRTKKKKRDDRANSRDRGTGLTELGEFGWFLISGIILFGIAFVIYQNSAGGLVSFTSRPEDGKPTDPHAETVQNQAPDHGGLPKSDAAFLAEIEGMAHRQLALHLLSGRLLAKASEKAGIRPGRSWTARESLRVLPRTSLPIDDLRHVNRQAELAWFGGRHVEDNVFEDCLNRARSMMRRGMTP